jgi:hypothetical protein
MLSSNILQCLIWFFLSSRHILTASEIRNLEIFWKINLDQTVRIRDNNLDCKGLNSKKKISRRIYSISGAHPERPLGIRSPLQSDSIKKVFFFCLSNIILFLMFVDYKIVLQVLILTLNDGWHVMLFFVFPQNFPRSSGPNLPPPKHGKILGARQCYIIY